MTVGPIHLYHNVPPPYLQLKMNIPHCTIKPWHLQCNLVIVDDLFLMKMIQWVSFGYCCCFLPGDVVQLNWCPSFHTSTHLVIQVSSYHHWCCYVVGILHHSNKDRHHHYHHNCLSYHSIQAEIIRVVSEDVIVRQMLEDEFDDNSDYHSKYYDMSRVHDV
jgi:hypothetical protein